MNTGRCPNCKLPTDWNPVGPDIYILVCARCGRFILTPATADYINGVIHIEDRPLIAEWICEQNQLYADDKSPFLIIEDLPLILARHRKTFAERVSSFLKFVLAQTKGQPGKKIDRFDYKLQSALQTFDDGYIAHIVNHLTEERLLAPSGSAIAFGGSRPQHMIELTPRGIMHAEDLIGHQAASLQCFVAMWFDASMDEIWDKGLRLGIENAGFSARRVDKKEHVNKICDEIIAEIRKSRFLVADFTGQRGGVYYEAGYASGRDIPVIWTCRRSDIEKLHFDIRQYNCIDWTSAAELSQRLQARIEAVIGQGPISRSH